jgi:hypothetical protein
LSPIFGRKMFLIQRLMIQKMCLEKLADHEKCQSDVDVSPPFKSEAAFLSLNLQLFFNFGFFSEFFSVFWIV